MTSVHVVRPPLDDRRRSELVFGGDLLLFPSVPGLDRFRDHVDGLIRSTLGDAEPVSAQFRLPRDEYLDRVADVQRLVRNDTVARGLLLDALRAAGVELATAYWDWVYLRVLPHGSDHTTAGTTTTGWHRDTWSSNVYAQINWWTPIYPVTPGRTIAFGTHDAAPFGFPKKADKLPLSTAFAWCSRVA
jgi:hypothetical protein